jgi:hypothetical protein
MNKNYLLFTLLLLLGCSTLGLAQSTSASQQVIVNNGIGLGSAIAVTASWSRNKSILWAIIHGILSWFYVIYFYFTR